VVYDTLNHGVQCKFSSEIPHVNEVSIVIFCLYHNHLFLLWCMTLYISVCCPIFLLETLIYLSFKLILKNLSIIISLVIVYDTLSCDVQHKLSSEIDHVNELSIVICCLYYHQLFSVVVYDTLYFSLPPNLSAGNTHILKL
jgi:hypothetical protein